MEKNTSLTLKNLLAEIIESTRKGEGEKLAPISRITAAQNLGCTLATGATVTKLIAAIEAKIGEQHTGG